MNSSDSQGVDRPEVFSLGIPTGTITSKIEGEAFGNSRAFLGGSAEMSGVPIANQLAGIMNCPVDQLHPHPSLVRLRMVPSTNDLSAAIRRRDLAISQLVTITQDRLILAGYAQWDLARKLGDATLPCLLLDLDEADSLLWIIQNNRPLRCFNDFNIVRLALLLEPRLKMQARSNQQAGGRTKGSPNLPEAARVDVRSAIAAIASVSEGTVSKVKRLLREGVPELLEALSDGEVKIHRAVGWLGTPQRQLNELRQFRMRHGIMPQINSLLRRHRSPAPSHPGEAPLDIQRIGKALAAMEPERKASVLVCMIPRPGKVMFVTRGLLHDLESQGGPLT